MTKTKIEVDRILSNFLRTNLTDINASRSGNWIYPDFPRVDSLGDNQFPRVGIIVLSETATRSGAYDDNQRHSVILQVDVIAKKDVINTLTVTAEALGTIAATSNADRMTFDFIPTAITNIKHTSTAYGTVTKKNTVADFTSPDTDTVEWAESTGDIHFSAGDLSGDVGEAIVSTYTVALEGEKAVQHLAREIWKEINSLWRSDTDFQNIHDVKLLGNNPNPIDEDLGIFRQTLEIQIEMFIMKQIWRNYWVSDGPTTEEPND